MGRDLGSWVEALRTSGLVSWDCACWAGQAEMSQPLHAAGGRKSGSGLGWQNRGRTKGHTGQEVALDSSRDGWPLRGHFLPENILPRQQQGRGLESGQAGRAWGSASPQAGPWEVPGGNDLIDV